MTTLAGGALPIPEQVIVGTGSYVVPADRYGFLQATTTSTTMGWFGASSWFNTTSRRSGNFYSANSHSLGNGNSASANNSHQWVKEGDSITTTSVNVQNQVSMQAGLISFSQYANSSSHVRLNGIDFCVSRSSGGNSSYSNNTSNQEYTGVKSYSNQAWSISLYRIPKGNLPIGAAEGE